MKDDSRHNTPCYCLKLRTAARMVTGIYDRAVSPFGLRVTQFGLLSRFNRIGPLSMSELTDCMCLDRTTLVRNLAILQKQGLIESTPAPDRRAKVLRLTPAGSALMKKARPAWDKVQKQMEEILPEQDRQAIDEILEKLLRATGGPDEK